MPPSPGSLSRHAIAVLAVAAVLLLLLESIGLTLGVQRFMSIAGELSGHPRAAQAPTLRLFQAPFTGQLARVSGTGDAMSWDIRGQLANGETGSVQVLLVGKATNNGGLSVYSGRISLSPSNSASCSGAVVEVITNVVSALCAPAGGASVPTTITFAISNGNRVTGSVTVGSGSAGASSPGPSPPLVSPSSAPSVARDTGANVFVIVMENQTYDEALANPYVSALAHQYALATDFHAVSHPSLPNYLALTSGDTYGIKDDNYYSLPTGGLGDQLTSAGLSWKAYAEAFTGDCINSPYPYAVKHNPFAYYGGACPSNVVSMNQLSSDLTGATPRVSWLIPGLCNDGHDCPASTADRWLATTVAMILNSAAWKQNGLLFITWDEDDSSGDNRVATLIVAPNLTGHVASAPLNHYSLLATVEDRLGLPRLGSAMAAQAISDVLPAN